MPFSQLEGALGRGLSSKCSHIHFPADCQLFLPLAQDIHPPMFLLSARHNPPSKIPKLKLHSSWVWCYYDGSSQLPFTSKCSSVRFSILLPFFCFWYFPNSRVFALIFQYAPSHSSLLSSLPLFSYDFNLLCRFAQLYVSLLIDLSFSSVFFLSHVHIALWSLSLSLLFLRSFSFCFSHTLTLTSSSLSDPSLRAVIGQSSGLWKGGLVKTSCVSPPSYCSTIALSSWICFALTYSSVILPCADLSDCFFLVVQMPVFH